MRHETLANRGRAALLLIDMQEKILPAMANSAEILARCRILAEGANILQLPIIVTEQYPQGLGATVSELREIIPADAPLFAKKTFSAVAVPGFLDALAATEAQQVLIAGIETHICVLQTALDLLIRGYQAHLVADACGSRAPQNHQNAARRLANAGGIVTNSESALFELLEKAEGEEFKRISKLIR